MNAAVALDVHGGAAGTSADLEAMHATGRELARCAVELADLAVRLGRLATHVDVLATAPLDPPGWVDAQQRLLAAAGPGGLGALAAESTALAAAVQGAAAAYVSAERAAAAVVSETREGLAGAAGQLLWRLTWRYPLVAVPAGLLAVQSVLLARTGDLAVEALADAGRDAHAGTLRVGSIDDRVRLLGVQVTVRLREDGHDALGWLAAHPGLTEQAVAAAPSFLSGATGLRAAIASRWGPPSVRDGRWRFPPEDVDDVAALAAVLGYRTGLLGSGPVSVRPARTPAPRPLRAPAGVADLVARTAALRPVPAGVAGPAGSRIRVERVRSPRGPAAIVYVPGTQTWGLGRGTNPMDVTSNIDAMAGMRSASQEAVVQALRAADVGRAEPLLLVGYSQGGMTSMGLVADPRFAAEFAPVAVLTAGAPVAGLPPPEDVAVLSLEHEEDLVTVLDGAPNPDRPNWTTVRREVLAPLVGDAEVQTEFDHHPLAPHDAESYVRTAALVDQVEHGSLREWREQTEPFLTADDATVTATDWVATRTPP